MRVDKAEAHELSVDEILQRWTVLFSGNSLVNRYLSKERGGLLAVEIEKVHEIAETWRTRLLDISWIMCCLNEFIARMANMLNQGLKHRQVCLLISNLEYRW